ncbi:MAG: cell division protein FtsQ [Paraglaciecola sp.]|jgi:cell division protein FtsQ
MSEALAQKQPPTNYRFIGGMAFLLILLGIIVYGGVAIKRWSEDEQQAPLNVVSVSGKRLYIEDVQIERLIRQSQPGSFFELDVEQAHKEVEAMPWVYRASVRKRWPNSLKVYVVEQTPAARWNDDLLLNHHGETFDGVSGTGKPPLPSLFGPGGSEQTALQGYWAMQALLNGTGLYIDELFLSERFAWNLKLQNGISLNLGRKEFIDRLQRFVDLYPLLIKQEKALDYIDLRYDTGLAVGWKSSATQPQES